MKSAGASVPVVIALALSVVLNSCAKQNSAPSAVTNVALASSTSSPQFSGVVGQFDAGAPLVNFLEKNANREVQLSIAIPDAAFKGSSETDNTFFILFDDCGDQPESEMPAAGPCTGTEINVSNPLGRPILIHKNAAWQLSGRFQVGEESGPLQGLMGIQLESETHL